MEQEGYNLPVVFWVVNLPVLSVHTNGNLTSVLGVMMYKERKVTASQSMMRQDAGRGNGGVCKPPVDIHITPINTILVPVLPLWRLLLLPPASVQSHCAGFNQAAM